MSLIEYSVEGAVGIIMLNRPPVNALSEELGKDLDEAVGAAEDSAIRAVVIYGDPHFAAGADIKGFQAAYDSGSTSNLASSLAGAIRRLELLEKPTIAAVKGYALGGGLELAMACTFRVASARAQLGLPEVKLGLLPGAGGTQRLPRLIGRARALDLLVGGHAVGGEEARELGLVDRLADEPVEAATAWATELAAGPRLAIKAIVRCVDATEQGFEEGMAVEAAEVSQLFETADGQEGVTAFVEKRSPTFTGR